MKTLGILSLYCEVTSCDFNRQKLYLKTTKYHIRKALEQFKNLEVLTYGQLVHIKKYLRTGEMPLVVNSYTTFEGTYDGNKAKVKIYINIVDGKAYLYIRGVKYTDSFDDCKIPSKPPSKNKLTKFGKAQAKRERVACARLKEDAMMRYDAGLTNHENRDRFIRDIEYAKMCRLKKGLT